MFARGVSPDLEANLAIGDSTDLVPRIVRARRGLNVLLLIIALVAFGGAAVITAISPTGPKRVAASASVALDAEASRLGLVLDSSTKAAHVLADSISSSKVIRAAILTDVATVKDLVTSEIQLPRNLNQTLELVQLHDTERAILLRVPAPAAPIAQVQDGETRFALDGPRDLAIVVGAAVQPYDATPGIHGQLALSTPLDLTVTRDNLAPHATEASLSGAGWTVPLMPKSSEPSGAPATFAITLDARWKLGPLTLHVAPRLTAMRARWVNPVRYAGAGLGMTMLMVLALSLYRNRDP